MDWGSALQKIAESSPYWGPFLVALGMILYSGGQMFMKVMTILSNGLSEKIDLSTAATKELTSQVSQSATILQKLADAVDAISKK